MATKLNDESLAAPPAAQVTLARSARPQSADLVRVGRAGRPGALLSVDGCRCWRLVVADGNRNVPVFTRAQQPQTPVEVLGCLGGKDGPVDLYLRWSHVGGRLGEARARPGQCPTRSTVAAARRHFHHYPRRPRRHQRQPSPDLPTQQGVLCGHPGAREFFSYQEYAQRRFTGLGFRPDGQVLLLNEDAMVGLCALTSLEPLRDYHTNPLKPWTAGGSGGERKHDRSR